MAFNNTTDPSDEPALPIASLDLNDLLRHGLLKPVRPASNGGGVLLYLGHLTRCFWSPDQIAWKRETEKLNTELRSASPTRGASPSTKDLSDPLWRAVYECLRAREASTVDTSALDQLLARAAIHAAAGDHHPTQEFFLGLAQLFRTASKNQSQGRRPEWQSLFDALSNKQPLSSFILKSPGGRWRSFAQTADRLLMAPLPSLSTTTTVDSLRRELVASQSEATPDIAVSSELWPSTQSIGGAGDDDEMYVSRGWKRGDSISNYLAEQSIFVRRRTRLGIESRSTTALAQLPLIVRNITSRLHLAHEELEASACLLALLQITFPVPAEVLLSVSLAKRVGDHIHFDTDSWCFQVRREHMHPSSEKEATTAWTLQIPKVAESAASRWISVNESSRYIGDLLIQDDFDQPALLKHHHDLLRTCSDAHLQCWPGMWFEGLRTAAVAVLKSELLTAYTLAIPGLTSAGSLHYLHPRQVDLKNAAAHWFEYLGLRHPSVCKYGEA